MKKFFKKYILFVAIKYALVYGIQFSQGVNWQMPNFEGLVFAGIILLFMPSLDLLILSWPSYWIVTKFEQSNNRLWLSAFLVVCAFEVYLTMICAQNRIMDWHIWKGVLSLLIFPVVFRETPKTAKAST